jgi:hypothetical protein
MGRVAMPKAAAEKSYLLDVTRELAERHYGKLPAWAKSFRFVCRSEPYEVGALVAVKWGDDETAIGHVKRKHSRILVGIDFVDKETDENFELAAWFRRSEVLPIVEVRAGNPDLEKH